MSATARPLDLAACNDAAALQAAVPPPRDPEAARLVAELGGEVDRMEADVELGRYQPALAQARALLPRVRAAGYAPLLARTLLVAGRVEVRAGVAETGIDLLYQAARAASGARDDVAYARALTTLIRPVGKIRGRLDEAARLITLAEGAAARVGQPRLLSRVYQQAGIHYNSSHDPVAALPRLQLALAFRAEPGRSGGLRRRVHPEQHGHRRKRSGA